MTTYHVQSKITQIITSGEIDNPPKEMNKFADSYLEIQNIRQETGNRQVERKARVERENWNSLRESKKKNFDEYMKTCGVPKIFRNKEHVVENETGSLFITGPYGTGKTYRAIGILETFVKNLHCGYFHDKFCLGGNGNSPRINKPIFTTVPELLLKIRSCFGSVSAESEEGMLKPYLDTSLLVLDDLGVEKTTDWALQSLYVIINKRYTEELQTIITSNLSLTELSSKVGDRIASRIAGMCKILKLTGRDRRLERA